MKQSTNSPEKRIQKGIHNNIILIGSAALKGNEIDDLIVAPEYQGRGIGIEIFLWASEHISNDPVIIHVADWNKRAIQLYKSCGFEITNTFEIS